VDEFLEFGRASGTLGSLAQKPWNAPMILWQLKTNLNEEYTPSRRLDQAQVEIGNLLLSTPVNNKNPATRAGFLLLSFVVLS